ncbi:MAG: hypothetical protein AB7Q16_05930 [Vicinamibacterales bacterium]
MARIYQPLQRQRDGRWNMTVSSDEERWTHAVGFCAGTFDQCWPPHNPSEPQRVMAWGSVDAYEADRLKHRVHEALYHDDGHATAEEAQACYDRYCRLLHRRDFDEKDVQRKCAICGEWTVHRVMVGEVRLLSLCGAHLSETDIAAAIAKERRR